MRKPVRTSPELSLAVQYATDAPALPRWRIRRWVQRTLQDARASKEFDKVMLTIRIVDAAEGRQLNKDYRHKDYATNVLTFPYEPMPAEAQTCVADIVLCEPVLAHEANEQTKKYLDHAAHLCIHATLHALGYDHEDESEAAEMEDLETTILGKIGIADPYRDKA